jgi:hypothetical protein
MKEEGEEKREKRKRRREGKNNKKWNFFSGLEIFKKIKDNI